MSGQFIKISLSGSPAEIGFQHGKSLSEQIHRNIEFYKPIFLSKLGDEAQVLKAAELFKEQIKKYNVNYSTEIDHIALGAEVSEPLWLYAMNSRTEIAVSKNSNECTAIIFPQHNKIGQTWDWAQHLEDNSVIMEIKFSSGHKILQLTEAGILGKIGLNDNGLAQTLNIIRIAGRVLKGVPVHIVLRAALESQTLEEAKNAIERSGQGKASNLIIAQAGRTFDVEFAGSETYYHDIKDEVYAHTNHYIHSPKPIQIDETAYANSLNRYKTAVEKLSKVQEFSIQEMISILSDQSNGEDPILGKHKPHAQREMGYCGTLATLVMDSEKRTMKVRKGNPVSPSFSMDNFTEFRCE